MSICEYCNGLHNGTYGSGRFCSKKCARGFSTKSKRLEINKLVSGKLKGRPGKDGTGFPKGFYEKRFKGTSESAGKAHKTKSKKIQSLPWEKASRGEKRRRLDEEFGKKCSVCGISKWMGRNLTLEWDHLDGNKQNESKKNLRRLCPNCHSQTPTFRNRKRNANDIWLDTFLSKVNTEQELSEPPEPKEEKGQ